MLHISLRYSEQLQTQTSLSHLDMSFQIPTCFNVKPFDDIDQTEGDLLLHDGPLQLPPRPPDLLHPNCQL